MTVRYHLAGTTDWGNASSWHDGVYGSSAVPVDTDSVYFLEGSDAVASNVTLGAAGDELTLISESAGFTGSVGTAGTPLALKVTNANSLVFNKGGFGRWNVSGAIPTLNMRSGYLGLVATGSVATAANVYGGELYCGDTTTLDTIPLLINGGAVTIDYKAADFPVITVNDGTLFMSRLHGAVVINGGRVVLQVMKSITASTSITLNGGELDWRAGYVTTFTPKGGRLITANQAKPFTITNAVVYQGTTVQGGLYGSNGLPITYTAGFTEGAPTNPK